MNIKSPVVIIGTAGSGKSSLCIRFIADRFVEYYEPTLEDLYRKQIEVDGEVSIMDIFDTAGVDGLHLARDVFIREGQGFFIIYAIDDEISFKEVENLYEHIIRVKQDLEDQERVPFVLVGTKCDLESQRKVPYDQGKQMALSIGASFFEASACTGVNVPQIFFDMVRQIRKIPKQYPKETKTKLRKSKSKSCMFV